MIASLLRRRARVRYAALVGRAAAVRVSTLVQTFAVLYAFDAARSQRFEAPPSFAELEVDYREPHKVWQQSSPGSRRQISFGWKSIPSGASVCRHARAGASCRAKIDLRSAPLHVATR